MIKAYPAIKFDFLSASTSFEELPYSISNNINNIEYGFGTSFKLGVL
jgi:hypothetical protein